MKMMVHIAVIVYLNMIIVTHSECEEKNMIVTIISISIYALYFIIGLCGFFYLRRKAIYRKEKARSNGMNA